ncbi:hypothetical protein [Methylotuvimicrobium sp.]|uniref:hypothetical protein n=1 Tax=Methylotuvimicrobium sp. TaxID=2822413 RepID=UPI003D651911
MREQDHRKVTLKYLAESRPSDAMLANFCSEFETLKHVTIPTVIEGLDLLDHSRCLILVREYFIGCTLREYATDRALPFRESKGER